MASKSLFVFVIAAFLINQNCAFLTFPTITDLQNQVQAAIDKLIVDAQAAANSATNQANILLQQLQQAGEKAVLDAQNITTSVVLKIQQDLQTTATNLGGAVEKLQNCTEKHNDLISNFGNGAIKNITGCVTEKIVDGFTMVTDVMNAGQNITAIILGLDNRIKTNCPLPANATAMDLMGQTFCSFTIVGIASAEVAVQAFIITARSTELVNLITSLTNPTGIATYLVSCFATRASIVAINSIPMIQTIVTCTLTP